MTYDSTTTLAEIRACRPCEGGWEKLLKHLGKTKADDDPLPLLTVLNSNGLDDAIWCLRVPSLERLSRHFQAWCAEQTLHLYEREYPGDTRVRDQISMLLNDAATDEERSAARDAAWDSAWDSTQSAASDAARVFARASACAAAWDSTRDATSDAARDAAWDSAYAAAWDSTRDAQERQMRKMLGAAE